MIYRYFILASLSVAWMFCFAGVKAQAQIFGTVAQVDQTVVYDQTLETPRIEGRSRKSKYCANGFGHWAFRVNDVYFSGQREYSRLADIKSSAFSGTEPNCRNRYVRRRMTEELKSFHLKKPSRFYLRGDACAVNPMIVMFTGGPTRYGVAPRGSRPSLGVTPGGIYSAFLGDMRTTRQSDLEREILRILALMREQCGSIPETLRIAGIKDVPENLIGRAPNYAPNPERHRNEFTYTVNYGGTLYIDGGDLFLDHDDKAAHQQYLDKLGDREQTLRREWARTEAERQEGARALLAIVGVAAVSGPIGRCNDPDLTPLERSIECE